MFAKNFLPSLREGASWSENPCILGSIKYVDPPFIATWVSLEFFKLMKKSKKDFLTDEKGPVVIWQFPKTVEMIGPYGLGLELNNF